MIGIGKLAGNVLAVLERLAEAQERANEIALLRTRVEYNSLAAAFHVENKSLDLDAFAEAMNILHLDLEVLKDSD